MEPLMGDYTLFLGDCLEEMNRIEAGSIDAIIADLPYGQTACKWDVVIPFEPLWTQFKRVIKKRGAVVLFGASPFNYLLWASNPSWYKYEWIWDKKMAGNIALANKMPLKIHEHILIFYNNQPTYHPQFHNNYTKVWNYTGGGNSQSVGLGEKKKLSGQRGYPRSIFNFMRPNNLTGGGLHPTQKPVALLEYLVLTYTNPGELVLDCTCGSGTTGVACLHTGRRFIGIEKDPIYFETAKNRLAAEAAKLNNTDLPMFAEAIWNR